MLHVNNFNVNIAYMCYYINIRKKKRGGRMKFISYIMNGVESYGLVKEDENSVIPMKTLLEKLNVKAPPNLLEFIRTYSDSLIPKLRKVLDKTYEGIPLENVKITAPIPYPRRNVFCLGKNYAEHAMEITSIPSGESDVPKYPIYFSKIADPAIGHMDKIVIPKDYTVDIDYEVELAVVIGKDGKDIPYEKAEDYIFGYTIGNDISARDVQKRHIQWLKGKSLDSFTPMGPWIVHKSEIEFPVELEIVSKVNGEIRQKSNTKKLIFDIPYIISDLSKGLTLRAGDIIMTGTPEGVGMGYNPPRFLKPGDVVECYIEKIGTLINEVE